MAIQVFVPVLVTAQRRAKALGILRGVFCCALAICAAQGIAVDKLHAETLHQALAQTYRVNPRIDAERARLRATDEEVPQARSGWGPTVTGSGDYGQSRSSSKPATTSSGETNAWGYSLNVVQPIFNGFRTINTVRQAEANVRAGRENLRAVEQQVLLQAVTAYSDVLRDQAILRLRRQNVSRLNEDLRAARARREVREITRTDVAQARARHARGRSQLDVGLANLKASHAVYVQIIGAPPTGLRRPSYKSRLLPRSLRDALKVAEQNHPSVVSAKYREQAARHSVDAIRGELLPDVQLEASYGKRFDDSPNIAEREDARITGRITVPFYRGGRVHSRVRQAKHRHVSTLQEIAQARQEVEATAIAAWSRLRAARSRLSSDHVQLGASRTALEGVRAEERVGQRTILDVLDARQELIDAQVGLAATRRDLVVAAYTMIAAVGRLNAQDLALMSLVYDADEHYHEVRRKWVGISIARRDPAEETADPRYFEDEADVVNGDGDLRDDPATTDYDADDEVMSSIPMKLHGARRLKQRRYRPVKSSRLTPRSRLSHTLPAPKRNSRLVTNAILMSKSKSPRSGRKTQRPQAQFLPQLRGAADSRLADGSRAPGVTPPRSLIVRDNRNRHLTIRGGRID